MEDYSSLMWFSVTNGPSVTTVTEHYKGGKGTAAGI